jgi:methyltransferase family protein
MVDAARAKAPDVRFDLADCQDLPYDAAAFDVVTSTFGFIFAPNHRATAGELARVCSSRLAFTAWEPNPGLSEIYRAFGLDSPEGRLPFDWGKPGHVEELLGDAFALQIERHVWILDLASGQEAWEFWSRSAPPFKTLVENLDSERRAGFRKAYIDYCERYRDGDRVRVPRPYLLVLGHRR